MTCAPAGARSGGGRAGRPRIGYKHADEATSRRALALAALIVSPAASADAAVVTPPPAPGPATGLADSAALRATVFGTPPQDIAPLPAKVPLIEIDLALPWRAPGPAHFLVRPAAARMVFGAEEAGSAGHRHRRHRRRCQHDKAVHAARRAVRRRLSRADHAVAHLPRLHRFRLEHRRGRATFCRTAAICTQRCSRSSRICRAEGSITDIDIVGYSLGGANAAIVKSIDAGERKLNIHRAVMINPPVSLFSSVGRLDKLYAVTLGQGDAGVERFYQKLYAALANLYRASDRVELDEDFLLGAAAAILKTDAEFSAAIALTFRTRFGQHVLRRRSVFRSRRGHRSEASAQGGRFAGAHRAAAARKAVLGVFHASVRAVLSAVAGRVRPRIR